MCKNTIYSPTPERLHCGSAYKHQQWHTNTNKSPAEKGKTKCQEIAAFRLDGKKRKEPKKVETKTKWNFDGKTYLANWNFAKRVEFFSCFLFDLVAFTITLKHFVYASLFVQINSTIVWSIRLANGWDSNIIPVANSIQSSSHECIRFRFCTLVAFTKITRIFYRFQNDPFRCAKWHPSIVLDAC